MLLRPLVGHHQERAPLVVLTRTSRRYHRLHWDPTHSQGRRRPSGCSWAWYVDTHLIVHSVLNTRAQKSDMQVSAYLIPPEADGLTFRLFCPVLRHMSERTSSVKIFLVLAGILSIIGLDFSLSKMLTSLVYELPNSRKHELEGASPPLLFISECRTCLNAAGLADMVGLKFMAKACYDPAAAPAYVA